jgi:hypothetical protein
MNLSFARACLRVNLGVLDLTDGRTAQPDQYDLHLCEDGAGVMIVAHVGDDAVLAMFDTEGDSIDAYRDALEHPAPLLVIPNGRILSADEVRLRLFGDADVGSSKSTGA